MKCREERKRFIMVGLCTSTSGRKFPMVEVLTEIVSYMLELGGVDSNGF